MTSTAGERAPRAVVVGAGIAGLAAAAAVRRERPDLEVLVLEGSDRVGGKLLLAEVAGVTVDVGAESILNRRPEGVALAKAAGLGDALTHPATTSARIWSRGGMRPMPRSVMGVPADADDLERCGVLSPEGLHRALAEPDRPPTLVEGDVSVGDLVAARFGHEVVDRLVEPLLGGVYAGHARELSARAATPQVLALLERDPSMLRAAAAAASGPTSDTPVFAGIVGGVGRLPSAVAAGVPVRTGATARELRRTPTGWEVVVGPTVAPEVVAADAVVVATPAAPTARLLADVVPVAARVLREIEYASMAIVTLAFRTDCFTAVEASGFLVPPVEGRRVKAATYSFLKWDWVRDASDDVVVMRTSVGRHREESDLQVPDEELVERSLADLTAAIGLTTRPVDWHVQRWGGGLPQYAVGHLDRVRAVREAVARVPALAVCGAAYDGLGIPACIASAERAVAEVLAALPGPRGTMGA